jgi:hypothetical protein
LLAAQGALYVDEVKAPCGIGGRTNVPGRRRALASLSSGTAVFDPGGCLPLLDPVLQGGERIEGVRARPERAVGHARRHEQPQERVGPPRGAGGLLVEVLLVMVLQEGDDALVVRDRVPRVHQRIGPSLVKDQLAAQRLEVAQVGTGGVDERRHLCVGERHVAVVVQSTVVPAHIIEHKLLVEEVAEERHRRARGLPARRSVVRSRRALPGWARRNRRRARRQNFVYLSFAFRFAAAPRSRTRGSTAVGAARSRQQVRRQSSEEKARPPLLSRQRGLVHLAVQHFRVSGWMCIGPINSSVADSPRGGLRRGGRGAVMRSSSAPPQIGGSSALSPLRALLAGADVTDSVRCDWRRHKR